MLTQQQQTSKKVYTKPTVNNPGTLAELTKGFSGSIPDEQGGHTKRNPFEGQCLKGFFPVSQIVTAKPSDKEGFLFTEQAT